MVLKGLNLNFSLNFKKMLRLRYFSISLPTVNRKFKTIRMKRNLFLIFETQAAFKHTVCIKDSALILDKVATRYSFKVTFDHFSSKLFLGAGCFIYVEICGPNSSS